MTRYWNMCDKCFMAVEAPDGLVHNADGTHTILKGEEVEVEGL